MFDEMCVRNHTEWGGNEFLDYVNYGSVLPNSGMESRESGEALVLMAFGI